MIWLVALALFSAPLFLLRFTVLSIPTNLFEVILALVFLSIVVVPEYRQELFSQAKKIPKQILLLVGLFALSAVVSAAVSSVPEVSLGILKSWVFVPLVLAWLAWSTGYRNSDNQLLITNTLISSGFATAMLSLFFYQPGQRLAGIYDVPNSLALWLAPIVVLALINSRWLVGVVMFVVLVLTQSVAGIVAVLAVLGLSFLLKRGLQSADSNAQKFGPFVFWFLLGFCALAFVLLFSGRLAYFQQHPNSLDVRLQLWSVSWDLVKEKPVLGIGLGQFEPAYQLKLHERFAAGESTIPEFVFRDPHNWPFSFWLNLGALGFLSFASINARIFWLHRHSLRPTHYALLTILLFGLVDTIYWKNDLAVLYWVLFTMALASSLEGQPKQG